MKALMAFAFAAGTMLAGAMPAEAQQRTRLTVYSGLETEQLAPFKQAIEAAVPGVEIAWVRDSFGVITARFLAERERPQADLLLGIPASSLLLFEQANLLETHTPRGVEALKPAFRDRSGPSTWVGMDAFLGVVCHNTVEARRRNLPQPASWRDLTNPAFRGHLVMPHPASSGTGYLMVAAWLQMMGEEAGWRFMDQLHENIAVYTHSGSAPCVQAARGERVTGIGIDMRGARERTQGAPIEVIIPSEGTGWDMEAAAIPRGRPTAQTDAARRVMDWVATREANELFSRYYAIVAHPAVTNRPANYPADAEEKMFANDFDWMASNRTRILAEWSRRYEAKAAPRN